MRLRKSPRTARLHHNVCWGIYKLTRENKSGRKMAGGNGRENMAGEDGGRKRAGGEWRDKMGGRRWREKNGGTKWAGEDGGNDGKNIHAEVGPA
jgi:hypothetical protein